MVKRKLADFHLNSMAPFASTFAKDGITYLNKSVFRRRISIVS